MPVLKGMKVKEKFQVEISLPASYIKDIQKAILILQEIGFSELYLFGSLIREDFSKQSDIDLAVKGLPEDKYHYALGKLDYELEHPIDLVNLDKKTPFIQLIKEEMLVKIA
jgi:predicted nucleotidyltransferase